MLAGLAAGVALEAGGVALDGAPALPDPEGEGVVVAGAVVEGAVTDRDRLAGAWLTWGGDALVGAPVAGVVGAGSADAVGLGAATAPDGFRVSREIANSGRLVAAPRTPKCSGEDVRRGRTTAMSKGQRCGIAARSADLTGRPSVPDRPLGPV